LIHVFLKVAFLSIRFGQLADMSKQILLLMEKLLLWLLITYSLQYSESSIQDLVAQYYFKLFWDEHP